MSDYGYSHSQDETGLIHTIQGSGKTLDGTFYPSKKLIFDSTNGEMYLECNTCIEYDTPRTGTEPWVHLLLEPSEFTINNNLVKISEYNELLMECNYEVTKFEDFLGDNKYKCSRCSICLVYHFTKSQSRIKRIWKIYLVWIKFI